MVLWAVGPGRLDDVADRAAAIVGTRASTAYGEHVAADLADGLAEQGRRRGVGRRVRHRRGGPPGRACRRRVDRRGAGRWHRRALPGGARRLVAPDPRGRPGGHRVPAGYAAGAPPVPDPQPAGRRVGGGDRGRRGRRAQRRRQHRGVGRGAGTRGVRGAGTGDLVGVGRVPCAAAGRSEPGDPRRGRRRAGGPGGRAGARRAAAGVAARRAGRGRAAGVRRAAGPRRAHRSTRSRWRPVCQRRRCWGRWLCSKSQGWW